MGLNLLQEEINEAYAQRGWRWEIQIPTSEEGIRLFEETLRADYEASLVDRMIPHQRAYNTVMWRLQGLMPSQENENEQTMTDEARGGRAPQIQEIKIMEVIALLKKGYTRYRKDNKGYGSIQEKFGLSVNQVKELFAHEGLKGLKTRVPGIKIVDDRPTTSTTTTSTTTGNNLFD